MQHTLDDLKAVCVQKNMLRQLRRKDVGHTPHTFFERERDTYATLEIKAVCVPKNSVIHSYTLANGKSHRMTHLKSKQCVCVQ